jgi:acetyl esterase/lipase
VPNNPPNNDVHPDVHPDLNRAARFAPRQMVGPRNYRLIRALSTLRSRRAMSDAEVITLGSGVGVRLFRPASAAEPAPALLWIHGGGYVIGTAEMDDHLCAQFTKRLGITVASVEYRLAPEHPYPAALEDCYTALTWLAGLPGVDPGQVAIGGASAGGGLAAALALWARDHASPERAVTPAFQLLVYPMLDDRSSMTATPPNYRLWSPRANHFGWTAYLGDADPRVAAGVDRCRHERSVPRRRLGLRRTPAGRRCALRRRDGSRCLPRLRPVGCQSGCFPTVF